MTDVRELLGSALLDEPPATVDPYAAVATGRQRRRTRRHRWLAGGVAAALVVGAVAVVGVPLLGSPTGLTAQPETSTASGRSSPAPTPPAVRLKWVTSEGTADTGPYLDTRRTLAGLDGVAELVQARLGLNAVGLAQPYRGVGGFGAVQLAYRAADEVEVHVLFKGPARHGVPACQYPLPPPAPDDWPSTPEGSRPTAGNICGPDVAVATTIAAAGRVARTVAVWDTAGGQLSVTVTSAADAAAPVSLGAVRAVVELLAGRMVFEGESAGVDATYTGPVTSTVRDRSLGLTLAPPAGAAKLAWRQALQRCARVDAGFCSTAEGATISYGLATLDNPATINADGSTTRQVVSRPAYVVQRSGVPCPPPVGPIAASTPSAGGDGDAQAQSRCRSTVILDADTGSALFAASD